MSLSSLSEVVSTLSTPLIADACLRVGVPLRVAPTGLTAVNPTGCIAGRVLPARHVGSVDVFFEAFERSESGDLLVVDNAGRQDEGCIGDLTVLEAQSARLSGILVWGCHRDHNELQRLRFPVFSYGRCPAGPTRLDPRPADALDRIQVGDLTASREDVVVIDDDGAVFVPHASISAVLAAAQVIRERERRQALAVAAGTSLREQFRFGDYLERRSRDSAYTLRAHLAAIGAAIEI
jgi:regulator of RNase E activity RraA